MLMVVAPALMAASTAAAEEIGVGAAAILGRPLDVVRMLPAERDAAGRQVQHLLGRQPQLDPHVEFRGRQHDVDALAGGRLQGLGAAQDVGRVGAAEAGDHRTVLGEFPAIDCTLSKSPGEAMAKPASMTFDPKLGQRLGHAQLLLEVHREAGRLLAVAQRGVEEDDAGRRPACRSWDG